MSKLETLSLMSLVQNGEISKTGAKPKLPTTIPNLNETLLEVYRIPLHLLYYNDENGRIASAISRLDHKLSPSRDLEDGVYNNTIEQIIVEESLASFKKTKKSIKEKGQQVFGYVLDDGRVIDGNRRFTAHRQISKENNSSQFFEAVILPFTYASKAQRAEIKRLELAIQMGQEEREDYDPVDLSVDIYQTIRKDGLMTEADYAQEANIPVKDIKHHIQTVELMRDFLSFINADQNAYYLIKDTKLYTPLYELSKKLERLFKLGTPVYEQTKVTGFSMLLKMVATGGDIGREFRVYMKDVMSSSDINNNFNDSIDDAINDLRDTFEDDEVRTASEFRSILDSSTPSLRKINTEYSQTINRISRGKSVEELISDIQNIANTLEDLKCGDGLTGSLSFTNIDQNQINQIRDLMIKINIASRELVNIYEDEI